MQQVLSDLTFFSTMRCSDGQRNSSGSLKQGAVGFPMSLLQRGAARNCDTVYSLPLALSFFEWVRTPLVQSLWKWDGQSCQKERDPQEPPAEEMRKTQLAQGQALPSADKAFCRGDSSGKRRGYTCPWERLLKLHPLTPSPRLTSASLIHSQSLKIFPSL